MPKGVQSATPQDLYEWNVTLSNNYRMWITVIWALETVYFTSMYSGYTIG